MKIEIKIPNMGESITEATIGSLLKPSGSKVNLDDEILELETDKVNQVIYAPNNGIITFSVSPGQMVKIGEVIAFLDTEGEQKKEEKEKIPEEKKLIGQAKGQEKDLPSDLTSTSEKKEDEASKGPRRTKENFLEELKVKEKPPAPLKPKFPPSATVPAKDRMTRRKMSKVRKVIAERLVEAQRNAAMLTTFNEVDMTQVMAIREKYKEQFMKEHKVKLGLMSFFVKASVDALQLFPDCNSFIEGEDIVHREYFDIGIAVGTDKGLFVPVVRDCNIKSFAEIEISIESYANKAKEGSLALDDLQGAGFTITNGGVYGSLLSTPIINPPQCAILGLHKISKRAVVVDDQIVIRPMMYLALSYDHRLIDGKVAVSFLVHIKNLLEDPARVLLNLS